MFNDPTMSANLGNIGSGFYNSGYVGVLTYSLLTGVLIAFANVSGTRVAYEIAAANSFPIAVLIATTIDLATAILTHGVLMLIATLGFPPSS